MRLKRRKAHLTNSGSSANLLAVSALTSHLLEDRRLRPGDEVITVAAGFPTTVNPILQNGLVPVFVDVDLATYNTTADRVAQAIGPRTRAIIIAHALGNPFEVAGIAELAAEHELFLIEDNCDAVGSTYDGRLTGTFGDLTTVSFYPAHHLTMGEGGCVLTSNLALARIVESLRDWGRDCWCEPGENDKCLKRFQYQMGTLPQFLLRPQVHLLARRLQPEGDRPPGRARPDPAGQAGRLHRRPQAQLAAATGRTAGRAPPTAA